MKLAMVLHWFGIVYRVSSIDGRLVKAGAASGSKHRGRDEGGLKDGGRWRGGDQKFCCLFLFWSIASRMGCLLAWYLRLRSSISFSISLSRPDILAVRSS